MWSQSRSHLGGSWTVVDAGTVERGDLGDELAAGGDSGGGDGTVDGHEIQEFIGFGGGERPGGASFDQQTQQGVEPSDGAGALIR